MATRADIMSRIKSLDGKGGFTVSTLKPGTKLRVQTRNSFYEFEIIEGKSVTVFGGTRKDGTTRFPQPVEAVIYGSTWGGSMLKVDWIGEDMRLEFRAKEAEHTVSTSRIKNVVIESKDGSWSYSMDWDKTQ